MGAVEDSGVFLFSLESFVVNEDSLVVSIVCFGGSIVIVTSDVIRFCL